MLLKQGKTNVKYLLILITLAIIVGGGILYYLPKLSEYQFVPTEAPSETEKQNEEERQTKATRGVLTLEELKNAEYYFPDYQAAVKLDNGSGYAIGGQFSTDGNPVRFYEEKFAFGDLNNDKKEDAVVFLDVLWGKNHSYHLFVMTKDDGKPFQLASKYLIHVKIDSVVIKSGLITLDLLVEKFGDKIFDFTPRSFKYELSGDKLIEVIDREITPLENAVKNLLPAEAKIIDFQPLTVTNNLSRALVLWMINPDQHSKINYIHACPEHGQGSVYTGPTRVSLIDTREMKIINTVVIKKGESDSMSISYRNSTDNWYPFYFPFRNIPEANETIDIIPKIINLQDYNGDGRALEFAILAPPPACVGYSYTLIGYSEKQDKVIIYPIETNGKISYWGSYLFYKEPQEPGYWNYEIDMRGRGGCLQKYEIRYKEAEEIFEQKVTIELCEEY